MLVKRFKTMTYADSVFGHSKLDQVLNDFQQAYGRNGDLEVEGMAFTKPTLPRDLIITISYYVDIDSEV